MNTSYQEVFDVFISKIKDYDFLQLPEEDVEDLCLKYLKSSIPLFKNSREKLLDRDDTFQQFNSKLTEEEVEILASLMVVQWTTPQIYSITNMKQFLGDSEYKFFSQANHLDKLLLLKDKALEYADELMINSSYTLEALGELNVSN